MKANIKIPETVFEVNALCLNNTTQLPIRSVVELNGSMGGQIAFKVVYTVGSIIFLLIKINKIFLSFVVSLKLISFRMISRF